MNALTRTPPFEAIADGYPKKVEVEELKADGYTNIYYSPNRPPSPVYDKSAMIRDRFIFSKEKLSLDDLVNKELIPNSRTEQARLAIEYYKDQNGDKPVVFYRENNGRWQGAVIAPSSKTPGKWQTTYFDKDGFSGDTQHDSQVSGVKDALVDGFKKFQPDLLDRAMKQDSFHEGNAKTREVEKENARIAERLKAKPAEPATEPPPVLDSKGRVKRGKTKTSDPVEIEQKGNETVISTDIPKSEAAQLSSEEENDTVALERPDTPRLYELKTGSKKEMLSAIDEAIKNLG